jgi:hypothetical protein
VVLPRPVSIRVPLLLMLVVTLILALMVAFVATDNADSR